MREVAMKMPKWLGVVALLVLAGCQTAEYTGSGPLTFSTSQQNHFDQYRNSDTASKYFMVTEDGRGTFNFYCEDVTGCAMSPGQAINLCEMRHGKPCKLYADGNDVVWRFGASRDTATSNLSKRRIRGITGDSICEGAIRSNEPKWESIKAKLLYVSEAKRRGLTERQCARLTGRFTEQQIADAHLLPVSDRPEPPKVSGTPSVLQKSAANRFKTLIENASNKQLCAIALQQRNPKWDASLRYQRYVGEAERRNLTEQQCARITGRFSEEQIRKAASVISPPKNDATGNPNYDVEQQLLKVKDLLAKGLITAEEAKQKRKEILGRL